MSAVRALLSPNQLRPVHRTTDRRKLRLEAQGSSGSGNTNVLILNLSKTGILLEITGTLGEGETIEIDFPGAVGVPAVVKWSSGQLFGCEFKEPISIATVSAALIRASYEPPSLTNASTPTGVAGLADGPLQETRVAGRCSLATKLRWTISLAVLSWSPIIVAVSLASR